MEIKIIVMIIVAIFMAIAGSSNKKKQDAQKKADEERVQAMVRNRPQLPTPEKEMEQFPVQQPSKKKFRPMPGLRPNADESVVAMVVPEKPQRSGLSPIAPTLSRIDSNLAPSHADSHSSHEEENSVAPGILAMFSTPQTAQQAVVLSEILNRRNFD
ncbi:MAG: hypothetical protein FWC50_03660 [Planctomycetaceae bacterium]|nr:hypothetical protein [Planctomycetaceae bacterium]